MPVWHVARAPEEAIYIGRPSRWGNPFPLRREAQRDSTLERYRRYLWEEVRSGRLPLEELAALDGQHLACYCKPRPCHGDVLERAAAWAAGELQRPGITPGLDIVSADDVSSCP